MSPEEIGLAVARRAVELAQQEAPEQIAAAFALGSLAHGGFAPEVSDVDGALIFEQAHDRLGELVEEVAERVREEFVGTPGELAAARLSVFWSDWAALRDGREVGRFPANDRLDFVDHGLALLGADRRAECARPSKAELLLDSAEFAVQRFTGQDYQRVLAEHAELVRRGARAVTKAVLFPVRLRYTAATGALGRNEDAAQWYVQSGHVGAPLVERSMRWRDGEPLGSEAIALLADLVPVYVDFAEDFRARLTDLGEHRLAEELARFRLRLLGGPGELLG